MEVFAAGSLGFGYCWLQAMKAPWGGTLSVLVPSHSLPTCISSESFWTFSAVDGEGKYCFARKNINITGLAGGDSLEKVLLWIVLQQDSANW